MQLLWCKKEFTPYLVNHVVQFKLLRNFENAGKHTLLHLIVFFTNLSKWMGHEKIDPY